MGLDKQRLVDPTRGEDLLCAICRGILDGPCMPRCGHVYCADCLWSVGEAAGDSEPILCPECRSPFRLADVMPASFRLFFIIGQLEVRCAFAGCNEVRYYADISHHENICSQRPITCRWALCNARMEQFRFGAHIARHLANQQSEVVTRTLRRVQNRSAARVTPYPQRPTRTTEDNQNTLNVGTQTSSSNLPGGSDLVIAPTSASQLPIH